MKLTNPQLIDMLERTEAAIDPEIERRKRHEWRRALNREPFEPYFDIEATYGDPLEPGETPEVAINDAQDNLEPMLLDQIVAVYKTACRRTRHALNIRTNYGTGIMPSIFGAEMFVMERDTNTLPTAWPMGPDKVKSLLDRGMPELDTGLGGKVFECGEFYREVLEDYPTLKAWVNVYHPDLQGPIDVCELLWGSEMFLALVDMPDVVKQSLDLVTETYAAVLRRWFDLFPPVDDLSAHWGLMLKGQVLLRNDSLVNLSPAMYEEFVKPWDERILEEFGGGAIHYCGRATHCVPGMCDSPNLTGLQVSQPHLNDLDVLFDHTLDGNVVLLSNLDPEMVDGRDLSSGFIGAVRAK